MIKSKRLVSANRESELVDDGVSPAGCKQKRDERIPLVACKKDRGTIINPLARRSLMPYSHDPIAFTHLQMSISLRRQELLRTQKVYFVSYMSSKNIGENSETRVQGQLKRSAEIAKE
jgi:hypothetical protein